MAKEPLFSKLFRESPFSLLKKHMKVVNQTVVTLSDFFAAALAGDWQAAETHRDRIGDLEHEADEYKRQLRMSLPRGIFLPVHRTDLLELVHLQDQIPNKAKDFSGVVIGRQTQFPDALGAPIAELIAKGQASTQRILDVIVELEDLFRSGFSDKEQVMIERLVLEVSDIEDSADSDRVKIHDLMRGHESHENPLDMIFLYQQVADLAAVSDIGQEIGHRVLCMISR
jgi:uncharacterized protein